MYVNICFLCIACINERSLPHLMTTKKLITEKLRFLAVDVARCQRISQICDVNFYVVTENCLI